MRMIFYVVNFFFIIDDGFAGLVLQSGSLEPFSFIRLMTCFQASQFHKTLYAFTTS